MDQVCPRCGAKYFSEERTTRNTYSKCCHQGKISLPKLSVPSNRMIALYSGTISFFLISTCCLGEFVLDLNSYGHTSTKTSFFQPTPEVFRQRQPFFKHPFNVYPQNTNFRKITIHSTKFLHLPRFHNRLQKICLLLIPAHSPGK